MAKNSVKVTKTTESLTLKQRVLRYERALIRRALLAADGSVSLAATKLKTSHQSLSWIIDHRHPELLELRTPVKKRRKSIITIK